MEKEEIGIYVVDPNYYSDAAYKCIKNIINDIIKLSGRLTIYDYKTVVKNVKEAYGEPFQKIQVLTSNPLLCTINSTVLEMTYGWDSSGFLEELTRLVGLHKSVNFQQAKSLDISVSDIKMQLNSKYGVSEIHAYTNNPKIKKKNDADYINHLEHCESVINGWNYSKGSKGEPGPKGANVDINEYELYDLSVKVKHAIDLRKPKRQSKKTPDSINHPEHYRSESGLEVIDVIEAFTEGLEGIEATDTGNVIKYICRWKKKNGLEDLKKAEWYIRHLIDAVEGGDE